MALLKVQFQFYSEKSLFSKESSIDRSMVSCYFLRCGYHSYLMFYCTGVFTTINKEGLFKAKFFFIGHFSNRDSISKLDSIRQNKL